MRQNKLHIVSFDVPYPADYGGAIDVYYKLQSLHKAGAEIYLHCYEYGRAHAQELEKYCKQVWYYPRTTGIKGISFELPYIVNSRRDKQLLLHLQEIDAPILFEGVHTTYWHNHDSLKKRFKALRVHNIEHDYYAQLGSKENVFFKKLYYSIEAALLKKYELSLNEMQAFFSLSIADAEFFKALYPQAVHSFIAPFHPGDEVKIEPGIGSYCLYHGNLSLPENNDAVTYLLKEVIPQSSLPFIIAGKNPSAAMQILIDKTANCTLVSNPSDDKLEELVKEAHIHVLPTFQKSGVKLKLIHALTRGRHVLANSDIMHGTGLDGICPVIANAAEFISKIKQLKDIPFTQKDISERETTLRVHYDNLANAKRILSFLG